MTPQFHYFIIHQFLLLHHHHRHLPPQRRENNLGSHFRSVMALTQLGTPCLAAQTSGPLQPRKHPSCSALMVAKRKTASLQIRSTFKTQVFENNSEGIVCYRNESGEMICEGYDEGPRFQTTTPVSTYHPRDAEIIDLLQKNWAQLGDGSCSIYKSKEGVVLLQQEEN